MAQEAPPTYGEIESIPPTVPSPRPTQITIIAEQRPLLDRDDDEAHAITKRNFSLQKFILQWLGIGRCYGFICMLMNLLLFGVGVAVITLTAATEDGVSGCSPLAVAKVLTIAAGAVLILVASFWPCMWYPHRGQRRPSNFTIIGCWAWVLSLLYVGIVGALATQVYVHFDEMWPWRNHTSQSIGNDPDCDHHYSEIPLWTLVFMVSIMAIFATISSLVCGCFSAAGKAC